jgi:hypothetical protein
MPEWDPEPYLFNTTEVFDAMRRDAGIDVEAPVEPSPSSVLTDA